MRKPTDLWTSHVAANSYVYHSLHSCLKESRSNMNVKSGTRNYLLLHGSFIGQSVWACVIRNCDFNKHLVAAVYSLQV